MLKYNLSTQTWEEVTDENELEEIQLSWENIMPINSKRKGANGEREIANILKEYGYDTRRGQQFSGANGDADVVGVDGLHLEIKRVEKLNLENAMQQSIRDAREGEIPTVFHRKNRGEWLVTLRMTDFMDIWKGEKNGMD